MRFKRGLLLLTMVWPLTLTAGEFVIEDGGVGMTREELEFLVKLWTPEMQEAAANDRGDQVELLNMALATKKIADEANRWTPENNPDEYWRFQFFVRNELRDYMVKKFLRDLEVPDMTELSRERYITQRERYANIPEQRYVSHIFLKCQPPGCAREDRRPLANEIMAKLEAGERFEELVRDYSEDPGSKRKHGRVDRWLRTDNTDIDPYFLEAVFAIEKEGDYSGVMESNFGFHIIRLDEIKEQYYADYEEVAPEIIADLESQYKKLAAKSFDARYRLTGDAHIDYAAMEEIFAPYKNEAPAVPKGHAPSRD